jgi:hypothetical protein
MPQDLVHFGTKFSVYGCDSALPKPEPKSAEPTIPNISVISFGESKCAA